MRFMGIFSWGDAEHIHLIMKRLLTVQDISCVGKCSLTVALPIISAMGIEACPLPTALLSTQTAFEHFSFRDLTDEIPAIENAWEKEKIRFDTIESGYLGSIRQIQMVEELYARFGRESCLRVVDPAMADEGKLYKGFASAFVEEMKKLCGAADVIVPNLTEAFLLTGLEYREDLLENDYRELLRRLGDLGCRYVVLTGFTPKNSDIEMTDRSDGCGSLWTGQEGTVPDERSELIGAAFYDREKDDFRAYVNEKLPRQYHGTGDIFASVLSGAMTLSWSLGEAVKLAVDFTCESIRKSMEDPDSVGYGVNFEEAIPMLAEEVSKKRAKRRG